MRAGAVRRLAVQRRGCASAAAQQTISRVKVGQFISNELSTGKGGEIPVYSPRDGLAFTSLQQSSAQDVDNAVMAARESFDRGEWAGDVARRAEVLVKASQILQDRIDEFGHIETLDNGKTLTESAGDLEYCRNVLKFYGDLVGKDLELRDREIPIPGDSASEEGGGFRGVSHSEPVGVVAAITPWNYPLMQAVLKVAPALAAGCTVVLKPAAQASLTCLAFGELMRDAGVPPGVFSVVTGGPPDVLADGGSTGEALINHKQVDKLSFTGSSLAGQRMLQSSVSHLRPTTLELGGKSAAVVFADCDLDAAAEWVLAGNFLTSGQVCSATTRVLVQDAIKDELTERLIKKATAIRVGDPLAADTQMGPLISATQQAKVQAAIELAREQGAELHAAPMQLADGLKGGYYVAPHVLTGVSATSAAWTDEIFGPVMAVRSFSTEEEAVAVANETPYGLANAVFSADKDRCRRMSKRLRSGIVWENCNQVLFETTPFGAHPASQSGFGFEGGVLGLHEYVVPKTIVSARSGYHWGLYN